MRLLITVPDPTAEREWGSTWISHQFLFSWAKKMDRKLFCPINNDLFPLTLRYWIMSTLVTWGASHERKGTEKTVLTAWFLTLRHFHDLPTYPCRFLVNVFMLVWKHSFDQPVLNILSKVSLHLNFAPCKNGARNRNPLISFELEGHVWNPLVWRGRFEIL